MSRAYLTRQGMRQVFEFYYDVSVCGLYLINCVISGFRKPSFIASIRINGLTFSDRIGSNLFTMSCNITDDVFFQKTVSFVTTAYLWRRHFFQSDNDKAFLPPSSINLSNTSD